ncbi:MAG: hypothetical protein WDA27_15475 [Actinomycetota bacterium]
MEIPVVALAGPYTVVVIEGIRLPVYVVGGVNISAGELRFVDHATVYPGRASGAPGLAVSGMPYDYMVGSGSGNIATVLIGRVGSGELVAGVATSNFPLTAVFYGR